MTILYSIKKYLYKTEYQGGKLKIIHQEDIEYDKTFNKEYMSENIGLIFIGISPIKIYQTPGQPQKKTKKLLIPIKARKTMISKVKIEYKIWTKSKFENETKINVVITLEVYGKYQIIHMFKEKIPKNIYKKLEF